MDLIEAKGLIMEADDVKYEEVPVPEWGGTVRVRTLCGSGRDVIEQIMFEESKKDQLDLIRATMLAYTIVDSKGKRLFNPRDPREVRALGQKSSVAMQRVFEVAHRLSGIGGGAVEGMVKNSETDGSDSSPSD